MNSSDQWHPSDINDAASEPVSDETKQRRPKPASEPSQESAMKPATSGIMTLEKDPAKEAVANVKPAEPDVMQRLKDNSERLIACYTSWLSGDDGENELTNSLHEVRRVLARIEIELAASHADDGAQRPIPIPMHRSHKRGA